MAEDMKPGTGETTPPGNVRDQATGKGWKGGGVVQGMTEEGQNLEGITHRGRKGR